MDLVLRPGVRVIGRLDRCERARTLPGRVSVGELDGRATPASLADSLRGRGADGTAASRSRTCRSASTRWASTRSASRRGARGVRGARGRPPGGRGRRAPRGRPLPSAVACARRRASPWPARASAASRCGEARAPACPRRRRKRTARSCWRAPRPGPLPPLGRGARLRRGEQGGRARRGPARPRGWSPRAPSRDWSWTTAASAVDSFRVSARAKDSSPMRPMMPRSEDVTSDDEALQPGRRGRGHGRGDRDRARARDRNGAGRVESARAPAVDVGTVKLGAARGTVKGHGHGAGRRGRPRARRCR